MAASSFGHGDEGLPIENIRQQPVAHMLQQRGYGKNGLHGRGERGRHRAPFSLPYPHEPNPMPSDLAAVKGLVLAMLARQPAGCAWLRFPAAPPLTSA